MRPSRQRAGSRLTRGLPASARLVIWFFLGSVLSLVAFDLSDYANYAAQASGRALSPAMQVFYFAYFPTILYLTVGAVAVMLFRFRLVSPSHFVEFFLISIVVVPALAGLLFLPQDRDYWWDAGVVVGTFASLVIAFGLLKDIGAVSRR